MAQSRLNELQRAAASHFGGPALVLAGPGTGKTTTLVARYQLLLEKGVDPSQILATTFTRASSVQLKQRIARRTGLSTGNLMIGTFHALCYRLLRTEVGRSLGLAEVKLVGDAYRFRIIRDVMDSSLEAEDVRDAIDRYKDRLISPAAAWKELEGLGRGQADDAEKYVRAYEGYQKRLQNRGLHDYGDLLMRVVHALARDPKLRGSLSSRYRFLMVDEFQDVNPAQHELIQLLLDQHDNLWAVGDDDQAIYGWRGSDVRYILDFVEAFPNASVYKLAENYRSQPVVVERATQLVGHNRARFAKLLRAVACPSARRAVTVCMATAEGAEARWIARSVDTLVSVGVPFKDMAVLVRVNYLIPAITSALAACGIPFFVRGGVSVWGSTPARAFLGGLSLWSQVPQPRWTAPAYLESDITDWAVRHRRDSFSAVVDSLADLIARRKPFRGQTEKEIEWEGIAERLKSESKRFEECAGFLEHAEKQAASESKEPVRDGVCVSTIHQAKGLEWRAVFLAGCELGIMPHTKSIDREEERRLAYVAVTRAKDHLAISWAQMRGSSGGGVSPYVKEFIAGASAKDIERMEWPERQSNRSGAKRSVVSRRHADAKVFASKPKAGSPAFAPGSLVYFSGYGVGKVIAREGERLDVQFERGTRMKVPIGSVEQR